MSGPLSRPDLDAVTVDTLIALANRGLVKRAQRELDSASPPMLQEAAGVLSAVFADGARAELAAAAPVTDATCSCGAKSLCRHRIGLVLAYQRRAVRTEPDAESVTRWSPGAISDDDLSGHFGAAAMRAARRRMAAGFAATVHRENQPKVEFSTSTVIFRVAGRIDYATCDSAGQHTEIAIILAVWACRVADERDPAAARIVVDVGDSPDTGAATLADALSREVLNVGTANASEILLNRVTDVTNRLEQLNARWLADGVGDLRDQLHLYQERGALFDVGRVAELLAELRARTSAAGGPLLTPSQIIGADEARSTPMKLTTLTALGATVRRRGPSVSMVAYVAGDGTVMTIHRDWPDRPSLGGAAVAATRIVGTTIGRLAAGSIVTAASERLANRRLKLSTSVAARTSVTPVGRAWENLPGNIRFDDFRELDHQLRYALPKLVRPRHEATDVKVLVVADVSGVHYEPGSQRLRAEIADAHGYPALVVDDYRAETPGALDALAAALRATALRPIMISGVIRRSFGRVLVRPIAILVDADLTIPAFAQAPPDLLPTDHLGRQLGAAGKATEDVLDYLAYCAHGGLAQLPRDFAARVGEHAERLQKLGFDTTAAAVSACGAGAHGDALPDTWTAAMVRLLTLSERL